MEGAKNLDVCKKWIDLLTLSRLGFKPTVEAVRFAGLIPIIDMLLVPPTLLAVKVDWGWELVCSDDRDGDEADGHGGLVVTSGTVLSGLAFSGMIDDNGDSFFIGDGFRLTEGRLAADPAAAMASTSRKDTDFIRQKRAGFWTSPSFPDSDFRCWKMANIFFFKFRQNALKTRRKVAWLLIQKIKGLNKRWLYSALSCIQYTIIRAHNLS